MIEKTANYTNSKEICSKKFCINNCKHGQYRNGMVVCLLGSKDKIENAPMGNSTRGKRYIKRGKYILEFKKDSKAAKNRRYGETTRRGERLSRSNLTKLECTTNRRKLKVENDR